MGTSTVPSKKSKIPFIGRVNLSEGYDTTNEVELFLTYVKTLRFYRPGLIYHGDDGDALETILRKGFADIADANCKGLFFASTEDSLAEACPDGAYKNVIDFFKNPVIVIYDSELIEDNGAPRYCLKDGIDPRQAVLAIIFVEVARNSTKA